MAKNPNNQTANENKIEQVFSLQAIFSKTDSILTGGAKKAIYKPEIFIGLTKEEKRHRRTQLRNKLDAFISESIKCRKDETKLDALRKVWKEYAKAIYINVDCVCDSNRKTENSESIKNFLSLMNK